MITTSLLVAPYHPSLRPSAARPSHTGGYQPTETHKLQPGSRLTGRVVPSRIVTNSDLANRDPSLARETSTSRSGIVEPRVGGEPRRSWPVLAENWWLYWPLCFLSSRHPEIAIISPEDDKFELGHRTPVDWKPFMTALSSGGYAVAFADGELERLISSCVPSSRRRQWDIQDYAGRRLISVFRVESEQ